MPRFSKQQTWQEALSDLITDPKELLEFLELDVSYLADAYRAAQLFPLKVTRSYAARMQKANAHDPLLLQVLPLGLELQETPGYSRDPLQEQTVNPLAGLLHKYHGRVLVTLTSACAIHCRYCFRRHFPYAENNPGRKGWEHIFSYLRNDISINEVILSGGDPLAVNDHLLQSFIKEITTISHIKRIRFHTRLPIVLPERITADLIDILTQSKLEIVMVVHANHSQEISAEVRQVLSLLRQANITLLNQSVLLKHVNDDGDTLCQLSETLFSCGVQPYYLHILDKVAGAAHFDLPLERALTLHQTMQQRLPGYLVPRLAREDAGEPSKTLLSTTLSTG